MMERIRAELLSRARSERRQEDVEQGNADASAAPNPAPAPTGRIGMFQLRLPAFLLPSPARMDAERHDAVSPKSPAFPATRRPPTLPPMQIDLSSLADSSPNTSSGTAPSAATATANVNPPAAPSSIYSQPDMSTFQPPSRPEPVATARPSSSGSAEETRLESFSTPDPAEAELARLGEDGRRRRERRRKRKAAAQGSRSRKPPKRFLFCFPWVKSRRVRALILRCFVSGLFLAILLSICE